MAPEIQDGIIIFNGNNRILHPISLCGMIMQERGCKCFSGFTSPTRRTMLSESSCCTSTYNRVNHLLLWQWWLQQQGENWCTVFIGHVTWFSFIHLYFTVFLIYSDDNFSSDVFSLKITHNITICFFIFKMISPSKIKNKLIITTFRH